MFASHPFSSPQGMTPAALENGNLSDRQPSYGEGREPDRALAQGTAPKAHGGEPAGRELPHRTALSGVFFFPSKAALLPSSYFFSTLISLRDLIVSQVAHQVHSIGRLEEDARCIDE